jgi:hypothetical protein
LVLNTFFIIMFWLARFRYPAHSSLSIFMNLIISGSLNSFYSSRLYIFLHVPFSSSASKIYLKILLSRIFNSLSSDKVHLWKCVLKRRLKERRQWIHLFTSKAKHTKAKWNLHLFKILCW